MLNHNQAQRPGRPGLLVVNTLATIQLVFFYLVRIPSYLVIDRYEHGLERMPFQGRLLMRYPLLWAHHAAALSRAAAWLTSTRMWVPHTVVPEDIAEFLIDVTAVAFAGFVARELYRRQSSQGRLVHAVYPVFLVMVAGTYCLVSMNFIRYAYDLPSLGLFAAGLYFIYVKDQVLLFAFTFAIATMNRETSIFLLFLFLQQRCLQKGRCDWTRFRTLSVGGAAAALALFWLGFHVWLTRHFGPSSANVKPGMVVNILLCLWPFAWPQLAGVAAYTLPLLLRYGRRQRHPSHQTLAWMWVLPPWAALMVVYGSVIEIRLVGELLPLFAYTAVLALEDELLKNTGDATASAPVRKSAHRVV